MKILITGASGFVGTEIVKEFLKDKNYTLFLVGGLKSDCDNLFSKKLYHIDIGDKESVGKLSEIGTVDIVIHAAGLAHQFGRIKKEDFWRTNVFGTENICNLAVKLSAKHFLLISSVSVYGKFGNQEVSEDFDCQPCGDYAESKFVAEQKVLQICRKENIKATILRLGTVIGENDKGNMSRLITAIDRNRFFWVGRGKNKKSLIYKTDIAEIISAIVENKKFAGGLFNLTAEPISMGEIVETIYYSLGKSLPKIYLPEGFVKTFLLVNRFVNIAFLKKIESTFEKWLSNEVYSGQKLSLQYDLKPRTNIIEGIKRQVSFYKESKLLEERNK